MFHWIRDKESLVSPHPLVSYNSHSLYPKLYKFFIQLKNDWKVNFICCCNIQHYFKKLACMKSYTTFTITEWPNFKTHYSFGQHRVPDHVALIKFIIVNNMNAVFIGSVLSRTMLQLTLSNIGLLSFMSHKCIPSRFFLSSIWQALVGHCHVQISFAFHGLIIQHLYSYHHYDEVADLEQDWIYDWYAEHISILATIPFLTHHFSYVSAH